MSGVAASVRSIPQMLRNSYTKTSQKPQSRTSLLSINDIASSLKRVAKTHLANSFFYKKPYREHPNISHYLYSSEKELILAIDKSLSKRQFEGLLPKVLGQTNKMIILEKDRPLSLGMDAAAPSLYGPVPPPKNWSFYQDKEGRVGYKSFIQGVPIFTENYPTNSVEKGFLSKFDGIFKMDLSEIAIISQGPSLNFFTDANLTFTVTIDQSTYEVSGMGVDARGRLKAAGAFGRVFLGEDLYSGRKVAVKYTLPKDKKRLSYQRDILQEYRIALDMYSLSPYLAGALKVGHIDGAIFTVMDAREKGSLVEHIVTADHKQLITWVRDAVIGLEVMHKNNVLHADFKPANIFIGASHASLGDFGLSCRLKDGEHEVQKKNGTPNYMAPEVHQMKLGKPADIWSVGATLYYVLQGQFLPMQNMVVNLEDISWDSFQKKHGPSITKVVRHCLQERPADRPLASELIKSLDTALAIM